MSIQRQKNGRVSIRHGNHIRQEYWSGLPIPTPGSNPCLLCLLHGGSLGRWILYHWATWEAPTVAQKHPYYTADPWKIQTWIHRSIYTCFFFFFQWEIQHDPGSIIQGWLNLHVPRNHGLKGANCELPAGFPLCRKPVSLTPFCSRVNCTWGLKFWF